jgi:tRNA pseudouridine55 synthase
MAQFKRVKRNLNGVLLLDKSLGFSSNQALQKVKWLFQAAKAGFC